MRFSIQKKIFSISFVSALIPLLIISVIIFVKQKDISESTSQLLLHDANHNLGQSAQAVYDLANIAHEKMNQEIEIGVNFGTNLSIYQGIPSGNENIIIDKITKSSSASVAIFNRITGSDDFTIVATNFKNKHDEFLNGFILKSKDLTGKDNPAITQILAGNEFDGSFYIDSIQIFAKWKPIKGETGEVTGMVAIGFNLNTESSIRTSIMNVKAGKTGYVWVIGTKNDLKGRYIISLKGKRDGENVITMKDPTGKFPIQEMINLVEKEKEGTVVYHNYGWINKGESNIRQKIAAVIYFEDWDWMIGVSAYEDEFYGSIDYLNASFKSLNLLLLLGGTVIAALFGVLAFVIGKRISKPIVQIANASKSIAEGNLDIKLDIENNDEIGEMAASFKNMITIQNQLINSVNNLLDYANNGILEKMS